METITPDQLIPPDSELAHLFMQWSEDVDSRTWHIANTTNDLVAELEGGPVKRADIYRAVAARCKGQKPNTIRRLAEVAADFDMDVQEKYAGLLSFAHFRTARRLYNEGYTPTIDYALEWCVTGDDDKLTAGRFHTVGEMLNNFLPTDYFGNPLRVTWDKAKDKLYDQFLLVENDVYRERLTHLWLEIEYTIRNVESALDKAEEL